MRKSVVREYTESILIAAILALFIRTFVFQAFKIPTGSMEEHLLVGDHILVKDQNNVECARGLTSFSSIEVEKIKGSHSSKIKNILGYSSREEIIHKDDLVKV